MTLWRTTDPDTSRDAALSLDEGKMTQTMKDIFKILREQGPMIDELLISRYNDLQYGRQLREQETFYASESGIRTRRSQLVKLGMVEDTGKRSPTRSGKSAIVWSISTKQVKSDDIVCDLCEGDGRIYGVPTPDGSAICLECSGSGHK